MPEPTPDHRDVDPCGNQLDARGVAERVWVHALLLQRRQSLPGRLHVLCELEPNTGGAEWSTIPIDEQWFVIRPGLALQ